LRCENCGTLVWAVGGGAGHGHGEGAPFYVLYRLNPPPPVPSRGQLQHPPRGTAPLENYGKQPLRCVVVLLLSTPSYTRYLDTCDPRLLIKRCAEAAERAPVRPLKPQGRRGGVWRQDPPHALYSPLAVGWSASPKNSSCGSDRSRSANLICIKQRAGL
jgi:hypothetical protein